EGLNLPYHRLRVKIVHALKAEFYSEFGVVVGEFIVDLKCQAWLHAFQDRVEILPVNLDELAVSESWQGLIWLAREVGVYAHDEWKLHHLLCLTNLHAVLNLHTRTTIP